jgi:hypothetical protein
VREGVAGRVELAEELAGYGEVDSALRCVLRVDRHRRRRGRDDDWAYLLGRALGAGTRWFVWPTDVSQMRRRRTGNGVRSQREGTRLNDGHHRTSRRRARIQLRRHLLRLALRQAEEARQDRILVRGGEYLRQLVHGREAKATVAEWLDDGRVFAHQPGGGHAIEGRALREPEPGVEVVEQRAVPEVGPPALGVEVREGDEEVCRRVMLAAEEVSESIGEFACVVHARIVSSNLGVS